MKLKLKTFGVARDILGGREIVWEFAGESVKDLKNQLFQQHPELVKLNSLLIAVNHAYADDSAMLKETDEIALIPPVSGG